MARKVTIPGQNVPVQIGNAVNPDWYEKFKFLETLQPLSDVDFAAIDAAIAEKSNILRSINALSGTTYTFVLADTGKIVFFGNSSPVTVTIPPSSSVAWGAGTQIDLVSYSTGKVTFQGGSGVTILSYLNNKSLAGAYAGGTLIYNGSDVWYLLGTLVP